VVRGIGLRGAVAVNVITMIGIGPLVTIPLVLADLHGASALVAWVAGALIALCDGLAWAELGSLYPGSGGTYVFLREAFGAQRWGRLFAFLFAWQIVLSAPLVLASGYIGFAHYAAYLWPPLGTNLALQGWLAASVGVLTLVLLYRPIGTVGAFGVGLAGIAVATLGATIVAGAAQFSAAHAFAVDAHAWSVPVIAAGLGPALIVTLYDYYGYGAACTIGAEVRGPTRVLPRSVVLSILLVAVLYVALQLGVLGAVPWTQLVAATPGGAVPDAANYVASAVVQHAWGPLAAQVVTLAVLATAFASTFGNLLAYSRIPYAAAADGLFFRPFAHLHDRGRFPSVALVVIGLLALPACFLSLGDVINALTAGLVLIQSIAQLAAVAALRARGVRAPYRMWLYPVPALLALAGWIYVFCSAGTPAIAFGILTLAAGAAAFAWRSRRAQEWPFPSKVAGTLGAILVAIVLGCCAPAAAADWGHAAIVERDGDSVFEVDGKPFFVYGAAFFYERLPRDQWKKSMEALQTLGINTLDLYVPWNWHEPSDGEFDFDGHTNPRRDLDEVLRLAQQLDFKILLRPGPVIRNEWRNGGYPAWLLSRPEYGMPLHDLLEGRYPPTATLQNQHSDAAAAEWMRNATHVRYAQRWLERVLHECEPYAGQILAVALDDDQGAYLDNQTYPAPQLQAYLRWLQDVVHGVTGPRELTFINTYQMKVPASSPVWAMGNWYQSDAYAISEHDRSQLELSYGMLQTRPHQPLFASEFQAGWLEQPDDIRPRPADPNNTLLAMTTMIGMGVRGIVNFPAQDTLYPGGWEAPFANGFYAWDAALDLSRSAQPRAGPVAAIGGVVGAFGSELATAHLDVDAAVVYLGGSLEGSAATNERFAQIADATAAALRSCDDAGITCAVVDPSAVPDAALHRYPMLLVPAVAGGVASIRSDLPRRLAHIAKAGTLVASASSDATRWPAMLASRGHHSSVDGIPGGHFLRSTGAVLDGFLAVTNYGDQPLAIANGVVVGAGGRRTALPPFAVAAHAALLVPVNIHLHALVPRFGPADVVAFVSCMPLDYFPESGAAAPDADSFGMGWYSWLRRSDYRAPGNATCSFSGKLNGRAFTDAVSDEVTTIKAGVPAIFMNYHGDPAIWPPSSQLPVRVDADLGDTQWRPTAGAAIAYSADVFRDGFPAAILDNGTVRVAISPNAGARALLFQDDASGSSCFTSVGALRDDVAIEPPLSTTDRIAKYTHDFPAGMFNRPYDVTLSPGDGPGPATATFSYDAPDIVPNGARFERRVSLAANARAFDVTETADFHGPGDTAAQRAVSVTSLSVGSATTMQTEMLLVPDVQPFAPMTTVNVTSGNALGYYDTQTHELATIAWRAGDVEDATILGRRYSIVVRLTAARGHTTHTRYAYEFADSVEAARSSLAAADAAAQTSGLGPQVAPSPTRSP